MNEIFRPFFRKYVLVFFDDLLVYSPSWPSQLEHLHTVLQALHNHTLFANRSKCTFGQISVEYLGHVVSTTGVEMDRQKIFALLDWPPPTYLKEFCGLLGLTGYYQRFVRDYAKIAAPLTDLLKKGTFHWTSASQRASVELQYAMTSALVLTPPHFALPFVVEMDSSGVGIGAVLS
ncbi:uncharacterized mitochondrial protein AtMg00860-like [Telopea speciosissima]|uniref:uncharacterized mitochondrial protein AtMg00860-like n=1 Tax=Telopea speciosissima TaxID=54955 RepID=UPI001CC591D9|nr:uncharacterized mitochondrial protein AtMg00860-like [Telopea speciosissima]